MIARLLENSRPSAIGRLVVAIRVDAVYRVFRAGLWPHIFHEGCKRLLPALADGNASTSIAMPELALRIRATVLHRLPRAIFATYLAPLLRPVLEAAALGNVDGSVNPKPLVVESAISSDACRSFAFGHRAQALPVAGRYAATKRIAMLAKALVVRGAPAMRANWRIAHLNLASGSRWICGHIAGAGASLSGHSEPPIPGVWQPDVSASRLPLFYLGQAV